MLKRDIERYNTSYESSTYGAAFLSALGSKTFSNLTDLIKYRKEPEIFRAIDEEDNYCNNFLTWENDLNQWKKCVKNFTKMSNT